MLRGCDTICLFCAAARFLHEIEISVGFYDLPGHNFQLP